jgi:hypothetical protein
MRGLGRLTLTVVAIAGALLLVGSVAVWADGRGDGGGDGHGQKRDHGKGGFPPSVERFDLSGYKLETRYTLGRNTGNSFQQTYTGSSVQGVPVEGPFVGTEFPPVDYVALPVARKTLYVAWLDPETNAIVDAFVMNFKTGVVFDYAPDEQPESSGTVRILRKGANRIP